MEESGSGWFSKWSTEQIQSNLFVQLFAKKQTEPHDPFFLPGQNLSVFKAHLRDCLLQEALLDCPNSSQVWGLSVLLSLSSTTVGLSPRSAVLLPGYSSNMSLIIIAVPISVSNLLLKK